MKTRQEVDPGLRHAFQLESLRSFRLENGQIYALVAHNPDQRLLHDIWFGAFERDEEFRAVLDFILEMMRGGGYGLWLADLRHLTRSFMASRAWLVEELMPQIFEAGLEREAVVLPEHAKVPDGFDVLSSASGALRDLADGRVRGFRDIAAARRWLLEGRLPGD